FIVFSGGGAAGLLDRPGTVCSRVGGTPARGGGVFAGRRRPCPATLRGIGAGSSRKPLERGRGGPSGKLVEAGPVVAPPRHLGRRPRVGGRDVPQREGAAARIREHDGLLAGSRGGKREGGASERRR